MAAFYSQVNQVPFLGSDSFRGWIYEQRETDELVISKATLQFFRPGIDEIIESVAKNFSVSKESIDKKFRGWVNTNVPRWISMALAQECGGMTLVDIALALGLKRTGSIPTTIKKLKELLGQNARLLKKFNKLKGRYKV